MKHFFAAIALFAIAQQSFADTGKIKFQWGSEYKLPKKHLDAGFIGNSTDGYTQIGHAYKKELSMQHFDPQLRLTGTKLTSLKNMPKGYMSEAFIELNGNHNYWFFTTWDKKTVTEKLFYQEIDLKGGALKGAPKEAISVNGRVTGSMVMTGFYQFNTADKYRMVTSFNNKRMMIYYRRKPEEKKDKLSKDRIGYSVYDENMKQLWSYETEMPYTEAMMDNVDYQIDSTGKIYLLARVYEGAPEKHKVREYHFELMSWSKDQKTAVKIPFTLDKKWIKEVTLTEDNSGQLLVSGYYANKQKSDGVDGVFLMKLDEGTNKIANMFKGTYEFPSAVLQEFEKARTKKKMEKKEKKDDLEEANLQFRKVVVHDDKSVEVWGEQYYMQTVMYMTNSGPRYEYIYHYDDMIGMRINADGELAWVKKVPKQQVGKNTTTGLSMKQFSHGEDSYVFFMDNMKNVDIKPSEAPATHAAGLGGVLMAVRIAKDGTMTKSKVFDVREEKIALQPRMFDDVGRNQMITRGAMGHSGGMSKAALISFE